MRQTARITIGQAVADLKAEFRSADPGLRIEAKRSDDAVERVFSKRAAQSLVRTNRELMLADMRLW